MEESNLELKICNQSVDHLRHNLDPLWLAAGYAAAAAAAAAAGRLLRP